MKLACIFLLDLRGRHIPLVNFSVPYGWVCHPCALILLYPSLLRGWKLIYDEEGDLQAEIPPVKACGVQMQLAHQSQHPQLTLLCAKASYAMLTTRG